MFCTGFVYWTPASWTSSNRVQLLDDGDHAGVQLLERDASIRLSTCPLKRAKRIVQWRAFSSPKRRRRARHALFIPIGIKGGFDRAAARGNVVVVRPARRARSIHWAARRGEGPFAHRVLRSADVPTCTRAQAPARDSSSWPRALFSSAALHSGVSPESGLPLTAPRAGASSRPRAPDFGLDVTLTSFAQRGP